jgi:hypothetical protein
MNELLFEPPKSVQPFLRSDKFINLVVGPVGSTKTTAGIIKISQEARRVAPCRDGIRRSRAVWVRNTREQLRDTTLPDFLKWYPDGVAGLYAKTDFKFVLAFRDPDMGQVECEVLFRGLDDANDVRRLLSLNASFGILDEFREINPDIFKQLQTRLGRYPDKMMNGVGCAEIVTGADGKPHTREIDKLWGMSNAPDADTYWEDFLTNPPKNAAVFFQPSGMSPEADWPHFLKDGYYENICEGKTPDWIDVYVHAKFGRSLAGLPVFRCFNADTHVAKESINQVGTSLVIGADAGLNPTAVITQQAYDSRVLVLDAITGFEGGMGALRFIREKLKPLLTKKYPNKACAVYLDPTAFNRGPGDEKSVADIYKVENFVTRPARTNAIPARLAAVESFLTRTVEGKPSIVIDPGCVELIQTLRSKYRYKINQKGERDDTPEKNHPYSDYADALQYACLTHDGGRSVGGHVRAQAVKVKPAPYRWAA